MGGIIGRDGGDHDYDVVEMVAATVPTVWARYSSNRNFQVFVAPGALRRCCKTGGAILDQFFPHPPGPFKRVATLIVVGCLDPFYFFEPEMTPSAAQRWRAKMMALLVPVALAKLRVNLTPEGAQPTWKRLDGWRGFPSPHFKAEFLQFLEGMDNYNWLGDKIGDATLTQRLITERTARIISAMGLILEACYYWNERDVKEEELLRGRCTDFFDMKDVDAIQEFYYDVDVIKGMKQKKAAEGGPK